MVKLLFKDSTISNKYIESCFLLAENPKKLANEKARMQFIFENVDIKKESIEKPRKTMYIQFAGICSNPFLLRVLVFSA